MSADQPSPVAEGDRQLPLGRLLVAFGKQAEELRLKGGLQQTVILELVKDEVVVLSRAGGNKCVRNVP